MSSLAQGKTVIIDTLFDTKEWRSEIINYFKDKNYQVWTIYTKISDQIQQDRITENKISKERHRVNEQVLEESNQKFEEPENEENTFVFEFERVNTGKLENIKIENEKISLKSLKFDDIESISKNSKNDNYFNDFIAKKGLENWVLGNLEKMAKGEKLELTISNGQNLVGLISMRNLKSKKLEIGLVIFEEFQKQGYGTEAVKILIEWAKENLEFEKIIYEAEINNIASQKLIVKIPEFSKLPEIKHYNPEPSKLGKKIVNML